MTISADSIPSLKSTSAAVYDSVPASETVTLQLMAEFRGGNVGAFGQHRATPPAGLLSPSMFTIGGKTYQVRGWYTTGSTLLFNFDSDQQETDFREAGLTVDTGAGWTFNTADLNQSGGILTIALPNTATDNYVNGSNYTITLSIGSDSLISAGRKIAGSLTLPGEPTVEISDLFGKTSVINVQNIATALDESIVGQYIVDRSIKLYILLDEKPPAPPNFREVVYDYGGSTVRTNTIFFSRSRGTDLPDGRFQFVVAFAGPAPVSVTVPTPEATGDLSVVVPGQLAGAAATPLPTASATVSVANPVSAQGAAPVPLPTALATLINVSTLRADAQVPAPTAAAGITVSRQIGGAARGDLADSRWEPYGSRPRRTDRDCKHSRSDRQRLAHRLAWRFAHRGPPGFRMSGLRTLARDGCVSFRSL